MQQNFFNAKSYFILNAFVIHKKKSLCIFNLLYHWTRYMFLTNVLVLLIPNFCLHLIRVTLSSSYMPFIEILLDFSVVCHQFSTVYLFFILILLFNILSPFSISYRPPTEIPLDCFQLLTFSFFQWRHLWAVCDDSFNIGSIIYYCLVYSIYSSIPNDSMSWRYPVSFLFNSFSDCIFLNYFILKFQSKVIFTTLFYRLPIYNSTSCCPPICVFPKFIVKPNLLNFL